jgi:UDP-N-acetylglucosamine acyltransferase
VTSSTDGHLPQLEPSALEGRVCGIHRTAIVDPGAAIGRDVDVGPNSIIGPRVVIGEGTRIGANCLLEGRTTLGKRCRVFHSAVIGSEPQDFKYGGEDTAVTIGDGTTIREFVTIHRATGEGKETRIGSDSFIMAYAHVAHNCSLGNGVIVANAVNMAGHVTLHDHAGVSGGTVIHQFVRLGKYCYVGGGSRIPMDITPYVMVAGYPARVNGLNTVGLQRHGFSAETIQILKQAYKLLFRSNLNVTQAVERVKADLERVPEVEYLIQFIESSQRGITL